MDKVSEKLRAAGRREDAEPGTDNDFFADDVLTIWPELCALVEAVEKEITEAPRWKGESIVIPASWFAYQDLSRRLDNI